MSRKGPAIDFNPLLQEVRSNINFLCYLGLHQYAKQHKLIGRSRPMITKELDNTMQRRLNFRLIVACIQQIIGETHLTHGEREEQINYVNVGNYAQLRLYGLLDRDVFAIDTSKTSSLTGYWPHQFGSDDIEALKQQAEIGTIFDDLSYNVRAIIEIGGDIFTKHLRDALSYIPDELIDLKPHQQRHPRERMRVKNLSLNLQLVETRPYRHLTQPARDLDPARRHPVERMPGFIDVPCHIERLLYFKDTLWPWVQELSKPEAREAFGYVSENFPGMQAIQVKIAKIRQSAAEQERREREVETAREEREQAQALLRERLIATYGEDAVRDVDDERVAAMVDQAEDAPLHRHTGHLPDLIAVDEVDERFEAPPHRHAIEGTFVHEGVQREIEGPRTVVLPDVHHGETAAADVAEDITQRLLRVLGDTEDD